MDSSAGRVGRGRGRRRANTRQLVVLAAAGIALLVVVVALVALIASCASGGEKNEGAQKEIPNIPATVETLGEPAGPVSTPRELWAKGTMPYLYQIDPQWSEVEYSGDRFAKQGCGPTALDMVYIYLTGDTSYDPADMAAFATENGYSTDEGGSAWELMTEGAAKLGITGISLSPTYEAVLAELEAGRPVICIMVPGTFTEVGHYMVLERLTEDGSVVVHDSNSVGRSMKTWDLELVCSEAAGAWSFVVTEGN